MNIDFLDKSKTDGGFSVKKWEWEENIIQYNPKMLLYESINWNLKVPVNGFTDINNKNHKVSFDMLPLQLAEMRNQKSLPV